VIFALDPGIGFGKSDEHNWTLLARLGELRTWDAPLSGVSRKGFLGRLLGRDVTERMAGSWPWPSTRFAWERQVSRA